MYGKSFIKVILKFIFTIDDWDALFCCAKQLSFFLKANLIVLYVSSARKVVLIVGSSFLVL